MTNAGFTSIDQYRDVEALNAYDELRALDMPEDRILDGLAAMSRDNARTPVQWDDSPHAGFTTGTPWLPATANHAWLNAAAQREDPDSVAAFYRELIALRHRIPVVAHGDFTMLLPEDPRVFAYRRELDGTRLTVVANLSGEPVEAPVDVHGASLLLHNRGAAATLTTAGAGIVPLEPWETRVYLAD